LIKARNNFDSESSAVISPEFRHQLLTPLNHIVGFSEMLTEQAQEEGQPGFVADLQNIHVAAKQLLALLTDSSPMTGIEARSVVISPPADVAVSQQKTNALHRHKDSVSGSNAMILVVDDNKTNRDMLSRRLEKQGHSVVTAQDGQEAIDTARTLAFDLILLDIMMPQMDGYTALKHLKSDEILRHVPVIMISALVDIDSVVRCIEMGAEDYLPKPFDPVLLRARVGACLEKKRAHDRETDLFHQLELSYKRLQDLERLRDGLMNMIVHDLRTPLTSVIVGMQSLEAAGNMDAFQQEMVEISISGAQTLLGMINDLLDVDKMESGMMHLDYSALSISELIAGAADQVDSLAKSKEVVLVKHVPDELPKLNGDENKLRRILVNLLGNALKFTPSGGTVTIDARHDEEERAVAISITDTGEGIPTEAFERIFDKFGQVESRKGGRTMSTGLGLAYCKLAIEAHGGRIGVESTVGRGSKFWITLPVA
jgi:two-component system sensor histidine kinase/response regulator